MPKVEFFFLPGSEIEFTPWLRLSDVELIFDVLLLLFDRVLPWLFLASDTLAIIRVAVIVTITRFVFEAFIVGFLVGKRFFWRSKKCPVHLLLRPTWQGVTL